MVRFGAFVAALFATVGLASAADEPSAHSLPIIFFHGVTASAKSGYNLAANLSTDARPFVSLSFCELECSLRDLPTQVSLAVKQIRSVTANDSRFDNGYVFVAHSQGAMIARAAIEEMDDHKVHTFISLAGAQNGNFYGPQATDRIATQVFVNVLGPKVLPAALFNFSRYSNEQIARGDMQLDFLRLANAQPALQSQLSMVNLLRSPVEADWVTYNKFFPPYNNMAAASSESERRKANFLRVRDVHLFASPYDESISPWQSSLLGRYENVASMDELAAKFTQLKVVPMTETTEYKDDTYGLQTLDAQGRLHLHEVPSVSHSCWLTDATPFGAVDLCQWRGVYEKTVYPLLQPLQ